MKRRDAAVSSGQRQTEVDGAWGFVGRSGAAVRRIARGAKHSAAGMGVKPIPGGQA